MTTSTSTTTATRPSLRDRLIPADSKWRMEEKAANLYRSGYRLLPMLADGSLEFDGQFEVRTPEGKTYKVDLRGDGTCTCECCQRLQTCKHKKGVQKLKADQEAAREREERRRSGQETPQERKARVLADIARDFA